MRVFGGTQIGGPAGVAVLALVALLLLAPQAAAHAVASEVFPAGGASIAESPGEIWVVYTQKVDPRASSLELLNADGQAIPLGAVQDSDNNRRATAAIEGQLGPGGYIVRWQVLSTVDGHTTTGSWSFAVGGAEVPTVPHGSASGSFRTDAVVGKSLAYAGLALVIGSVAFAVWVLQGRDIDARLPAWRRLLAAGAVLHLAGVTIFAASQIAMAPVDAGTYLFQTSFGRGVALRLALAVGMAIAAVAVAVAAARLNWNARRVSTLAGAFALASVVTNAAFSHTAEFIKPAAAAIAIDAVHLVVIGAWAGGLVPLLAALRNQTPELDVPRVAERFSQLAFVSILLATLTGVVMAGGIIGWSVPAWFAGRYGAVLGVKVALVLAGMGTLGALNRLRHVKQTTPRGPSPSRPGAERRFRRSVGSEVAIAAAVFLLAGALTNLTPSDAQPTLEGPALPPEALFQALEGERAGFHVNIDPGPRVAGNSTYGVHAYDLATYDSIPNATRLTISAADVAGVFGTTSVSATEVGGGAYRASGALFPAPGEWRVRFVLEHPDYDVQVASFVVDV